MRQVEIPFPHRQSAHCESGVAAALANFRGIPLTEPMAFGLGSGIFFGHVPIIKIMGLPLTTFRSFPGTILKKVFERSGITYEKRRFRNVESACDTLDHFLEQGTPVGVQLSVFWLPYLPKQFRFQFNAHHAVVCGKNGDDYVMSDPIGEELVTCPQADFRRAWFAKGPMAPRGAMYIMHSPKFSHKRVDEEVQMLRKSLLEAVRAMVRNPVPYFGVKGIRYLGDRVTKWPRSLKDDKAVKLNLGQVVRMQEEVGTGGAGFRFLYAAFLQEAARIRGFDFLHEASDLLTSSGDRWREFAIASARLCRRGGIGESDCRHLAEDLYFCADQEQKAFQLIDLYLRKTRTTSVTAALPKVGREYFESSH